MFKEIIEYLWYHLKRVATSRLFPLGCIFAVMFSVLIIHPVSYTHLDVYKRQPLWWR